MIKVLFFASLRERLGFEQIDIPADNIQSVTDVYEQLIARGDQWRAALETPTPLMAVNQEMAFAQTAVNDGDEVAFYPPVTGG